MLHAEILRLLSREQTDSIMKIMNQLLKLKLKIVVKSEFVLNILSGLWD
jgi:hypothetical protein